MIDFETILGNVRAGAPLVHNITNYVTVNDCANILLACGGSPIMSDDEREVEEITSICSGLNINIGTLNGRTIPSMFLAGKRANALGHPVLLDPVGAGASALRTETAAKLIEEVRFTVIRGNISEIKALAQGVSGTKGVDANESDQVNADNLDSVISFARAFAEKTGAVLSTGKEIVCENDRLYYIDYLGRKQRVGAVYRRISDEYLDPMTFYEDSVIGIPHIFEAYKKGNVALLNAPGNGVADDKGIYYFVPKMIKYYLGEDAILKNAPTYLPYYEDDMRYVLDKFDNLVIKDVAEAGGYGVVFGSSLSKEKKEAFIQLLKSEPRRFIAQEVIDFYDLDILGTDGTQVPRKADLRAFVLTDGETKVWPSGLTRFSRNPDSFIVNSSQGGGFKDTWVLSR